MPALTTGNNTHTSTVHYRMRATAGCAPKNGRWHRRKLWRSEHPLPLPAAPHAPCSHCLRREQLQVWASLQSLPSRPPGGGRAGSPPAVCLGIPPLGEAPKHPGAAALPAKSPRPQVNLERPRGEPPSIPSRALAREPSWSSKSATTMRLKSLVECVTNRK